MSNREQAWGLLTEFTQSESLRKHGLGGRGLHARLRPQISLSGFGPENEELWGVVGLLHDFDYEKYPSLDDHPYKGNEILKERGYSDEIRRAIMSHAEYSGVTRDTPMEKALFACDELAGFITACALVKPGKSLAEVEAKSVRKKMKDKAFARSVKREDIVNGAADLGVDLEEHIAFCIEALKGIAKKLGLDGSGAASRERPRSCHHKPDRDGCPRPPPGCPGSQINCGLLCSARDTVKTALSHGPCYPNPSRNV